MSQAIWSSNIGQRIPHSDILSINLINKFLWA